MAAKRKLKRSKREASPPKRQKTEDRPNLPHLPPEILEMIGNQCLELYSDQELWFGLARANQFFRRFIERDVVRGRSDAKHPLMTTAETRHAFTVGFDEKIAGSRMPDGHSRYGSHDRIKQNSKPHMWFLTDASFNPDRYNTHTDVTRAFAFDHVEEGGHRAVFKSVGERYYYHVTYEDGIRFNVPSGIQHDYEFPSLTMLLKHKRNLLCHFDPDGSRFNFKPPKSLPSAPPRFFVCAMDKSWMRSLHVRESYAAVEAVDCDIDASDPEAAVLSLTVDWREMWTKKLARERVYEDTARKLDDILAERRASNAKIPKAVDNFTLEFTNFYGERTGFFFRRAREWDEREGKPIFKLLGCNGQDSKWKLEGAWPSQPPAESVLK